MGSSGHRVAARRFTGSQVMEVVTPLGWVFESSLSSTFGFVPSEHTDKGMKFLRQENGLDVYFNLLTGKEVYVGHAMVNRLNPAIHRTLRGFYAQGPVILNVSNRRNMAIRDERKRGNALKNEQEIIEIKGDLQKKC